MPSTADFAAMATYPNYGYQYDYAQPIVDHIHERTHQHQNFLQYLKHQHPIQGFPNQPDVDVHDAGSEYLIEIELPGMKDAKNIHLSWTTTRSLTITGNTERPTRAAAAAALTKKISNGNSDEKDHKKSHPEKPSEELLVGERRIGAFKRQFTFPDVVEMDKLDARLEAGLLKLRLPKRGDDMIATVTDVEVHVE